MIGKIKIQNLDDHLLPNIACTKPVDEPKNLTLTDCLACAGCITSAETILLESQSYEQLVKNLHNSVISISPQALVSLYDKYGKDYIENTFMQLKQKGIKGVLNMNISINICLLLALNEFKIRKEQGKLPVFSGECPGWTCFAEKQPTDFLIPYMSNIKSPMQIQGILTKKIYENSYHTSIQPCYDKKIETFRSKGVDLVLSSQEYIDLLTNLNINMDQNIKGDFSLQKDFEEKLINSYQLSIENIQIDQIQSLTDITSNSYLQTIMEFLCVSENLKMEEKQGKNPDIIEYRLMDGENKLKYILAKIYGFKNIQNLVRNMKKKIMACPMGCLNGGGQIKRKEVKPRQLVPILFDQMVKNKQILLPQNDELSIKMSNMDLDFNIQYKHVEQDSTHVRW